MRAVSAQRRTTALSQERHGSDAALRNFRRIARVGLPRAVSHRVVYVFASMGSKGPGARRPERAAGTEQAVEGSQPRPAAPKQARLPQEAWRRQAAGHGEGPRCATARAAVN